MELKKIKRIKLNFRRIKPIKNSFVQDFKFFGLDVETYQTLERVITYSLQLYSGEYKVFKIIENSSERERIEYLFGLCKKLKSKKLIFFSFNLQYDITALFPTILLYNSLHLLPLPKKKRESFRFKIENYYVKIIYSNPCFLEISKKNKRNRLRLIFIDLASFFKGSLEKVAADFNLPRKLEKPEYLGLRRPERGEMRYFKKYAMQDAKICYFLGKILISWHKEFDIDISKIPTCSPAFFSSRIFKKHFLKNQIVLPHKPVLQLSLLSYWGGRAECFVYGYVDKCYYYDFNSFYPFALSRIIMPVENRWKFTTKFEGEAGFYVITAEVPRSKIHPFPVKKERLIFPYGKISTVVTGYELKAALQTGIDVKVNYGFVYTGKSSNELSEFVNYFYKKKRESSGIRKMFYKLVLNSLYGKFIQLKEEKCGGKNFFLAGGLFNPVIASWVTGFCRAKLYELMKKYEDWIIYCDTDSIISLHPLQEESSEDLGKLKLEYEGWGIFIREKCYILKDKFVHHGFIGDLKSFIRMIEQNSSKYTVKRIIKFREALRRKFPPLYTIYDFRNFDLSSSSKREKSNISLYELLKERRFVFLDALKHNSAHEDSLCLTSRSNTSAVKSSNM